MAPVDFYASESQYEDHLGAIWHALRPGERGVFYVRHAIANHATLAGIAPLSVGYPPASHRLCVVASFQDDRASDRPTVYVEHGAGQTYGGDPASAGHPSYSGGGDHDRVRLFICPSETVAERWRSRYPDVPAVAVGVPKLDWVHARMLDRRLQTASQTAGLVLEALCEMASSRFADYYEGPRTGPDAIRAILGKSGEERTRRLLALAGVEEAAWLRRVQDGRQDAPRTPRGLGPDLWGMAETDARSPVPQPGPSVSGGANLSTPDVRQPSTPGGRESTYEPGAVAAHERWQDLLWARTPLDDRLDLCASKREAAVQDMQAVTAGWPGLSRCLHHANLLVDGPRASRARDTRPVAAISFHAPIKLCPESDSAWPHYNAGLPAVVKTLVAAGVHVLGHAHPRLWKRLGARWAQAGAEPVEDFAEILARADVYAADNTSTLPEAASCGIPLVWMNAPWYRRDVDHGGRYWTWPRGQQGCNEPGELAAAILAALDDPPEVRAARERMVREVYAFTDGRAAERAADAIRAANRV